ncbi:MAG TPA: hypothetical protein VHZ03_54105 [Trebonia sp.]|nr:hypothetical protein [Trebonia sp.]
MTLRNRIIKSATYESMARRGLVTDRLIDFRVRRAAVTTVATDAREQHPVAAAAVARSGTRSR